MFDKKIIEPVTNTKIKIKKDGFYNTKTHKKDQTIMGTFDKNDKNKIINNLDEYLDVISQYSPISEEINDIVPKKLIK